MTKEIFDRSLGVLTDDQYDVLFSIAQALFFRKNSFTSDTAVNPDKKEARAAMERILSRRVPSVIDIDEDKELYEGLMEKYESID